MRDILVVDRGYLCGGASGRNGGGVRAQWSSTDNIALMRESIRMCKDFASEHRINVWFRQGGYLFLARSPEMRASLERNTALQNELGLTTRMLSPSEAARIVPELATEGLDAACYNPDDGVVFPWPFVWGFANGARKLGAEIATFTDVVGFDLEGDRIGAVRLAAVGEGGRRGPEHTVSVKRVVNAAGAWSPEIPRGSLASSSPISPTATKSAPPSR